MISWLISAHANLVEPTWVLGASVATGILADAAALTSVWAIAFEDVGIGGRCCGCKGGEGGEKSEEGELKLHDERCGWRGMLRGGTCEVLVGLVIMEGSMGTFVALPMGR